MGHLKHRVRISVELDADYHAFVERFINAGVCASRDEIFQSALDALAREMESDVRAIALAAGIADAGALELEELANALGALNDREDGGNRSH
jgi:Arc/MetJ-type ribon-helix-helix transcriptional regulator